MSTGRRVSGCVAAAFLALATSARRRVRDRHARPRPVLAHPACGRISLSIGLVGVALSFLIGITLGGLSGYYGGRVDTFVQRCIEFLISLPTIPLWMALAAALPQEWSVLLIYFGIVIILSLVSWGWLARVVRGKLLELREHDFVMAAQIGGLRELTIIRRHLLPSFASYLIVHLTLAIPRMILAETALSFPGLGLRSPALRWGVLLQRAQNFRSVAIYPWLLIVIVTVMAFNFVGDSMRDAADPYRMPRHSVRLRGIAPRSEDRAPKRLWLTHCRSLTPLFPVRIMMICQETVTVHFVRTTLTPDPSCSSAKEGTPPQPGIEP